MISVTDFDHLCMLMAKSIENARIFLNLFTRNLSFAFLLNPITKKYERLRILLLKKALSRLNIFQEY